MSNLFNFIQNENMKIYRRTGTWVMMGLIVAATLLVAIVTNLNGSDESADWRIQAQNNIQQSEQTLKESEGLPKAFKDNQESFNCD